MLAGSAANPLSPLRVSLNSQRGRIADPPVSASQELSGRLDNSTPHRTIPRPKSPALAPISKLRAFEKLPGARLLSWGSQ